MTFVVPAFPSSHTLRRTKASFRSDKILILYLEDKDLSKAFFIPFQLTIVHQLRDGNVLRLSPLLT